MFFGRRDKLPVQEMQSISYEPQVIGLQVSVRVQLQSNFKTILNFTSL